ncbi:hypothetical protein [Solitalea lacus]|uniref:hypothetical protein n=1 Tax=Solitalea lacus TaxID=2911172 RepID=UPI001EDAC385|nr:hypothetical protein [Solitalea lacus]UKJ09075.1 hypothetical protein L2B55_07885 [Solitalea lacus]
MILQYPQSMFDKNNYGKLYGKLDGTVEGDHTIFTGIIYSNNIQYLDQLHDAFNRTIDDFTKV